MTTAAEINQIITLANLKILSRTLRFDDFLELLPESQLATLIEAEDLLKDPEVEQDARSQLLQLITAIAACSSLNGKVKEKAIALVAPCPNLPF